MTMKPRVLLRIGVTIFIMVVVMTVLTRCGPAESSGPEEQPSNTEPRVDGR